MTLPKPAELRLIDKISVCVHAAMRRPSTSRPLHAFLK